MLKYGTLFFILIAINLQAQISEDLVARLEMSGQVPSDLLATKSVVLYNSVIASDLVSLQEVFQRLGVDAVSYYETDAITAGKDVSKAFAGYFTSRNITNLIFFDRSTGQYSITVTTLNGKEDFVSSQQAGWQLQHPNLKELLTNFFVEVNSSQERKNFLVNDIPEIGDIPQVITGRRNEYFAIDLKIDNLAVPKFGDASMDEVLESYFATNYPLKYKMAEPYADEKELRSQGYTYVLCYVHASGNTSKELLAYDMSKQENAITSVTYPDGQLQLRTISAETPVYKFYFRHISTGNVYLGTKWDADIRWQDALNNHIRGLKAELKIN